MEIILPFLAAFAITCCCVPFTIKLATRYGLVDDPSKRPHPAHFHKTIKPRAGGLPIYLGIVLAALFFLPLSKALLGIVIGITILLLLGLMDDKLVYFNPYIRLLFLFLAAAAAVGAGIGIVFMANPFFHFLQLPAPFDSRYVRLDQVVIPIQFFGTHTIILFADLFAFFWIVTLTQVINWAKGVDGQMPSITMVAAITLGFLSLKLYTQGDINQLSIAQLSFIVAGSSLGFLIFNWFPSKILPGFSASTILAFMLAVLSIQSGAKVATASLALAVPIVDFFYTIIRRISRGKSPVWGDRGHLHHKLLDMGWKPQQISLFYMVGSGILGSVALFVDSASKLFATIVVAIIFFVFVLWINSFLVLSEKSDQGSGSKT